MFPFADGVPGDPSLIHPIAEAIAKKWNTEVLGFNWLGVAIRPSAIGLLNGGYGWGLFSVKEGKDGSNIGGVSWNCNSGTCTSVQYTNPAESESAVVSVYSRLGVRSPGMLPSILAATASKKLPMGMTIDCISGSACEWK